MRLEDIDKLLSEVTQGDWGVDARVGCLVVSSTGQTICSTRTSHNNKRDPEEQEAEQAANAGFIAAAPTIIKELVERVMVLELNAMRIGVVLDAAKGVIEDGDYDVHFENRSAALIDSGLLLRLENAVKALDAKERGDV